MGFGGLLPTPPPLTGAPTLRSTFLRSWVGGGPGESWEQLVQQEEESGASAVGGAPGLGQEANAAGLGPPPRAGAVLSLFGGDLLQSIKRLLAR